MEALELVARLLEKTSVLIATILMLVMVRPAGVWLGETGKKASFRRRGFLIIALGALAVWGTFLGFAVGGVRFNVRMVGIMVAGYLGGSWVGVVVGTIAGIVYAFHLGISSVGIYAFAASVLVGAIAGLWSRKFGTNVVSVIIGSIVIQAAYHMAIGGVMVVVDPEVAATQTANWMLHAAKIAANVVGVVLFMGVLNLVSELERARVDAKASQVEARSAKLEALQYQVKPHFLFNLLNTLSFLIRTNPEKARTLTHDLADFLRYTLSRPDAETTLSDELKQLSKYVDLERARFGDGLQFETPSDLDAFVGALAVPPLLLQPLVENAIQHGSVDGRVAVKITTKRDEDALIITVQDDGPGPEPDKEVVGGVGLENVRERLNRFYRGRASLKLTKNAEGAAAIVTIPLSTESLGLIEQAREKFKEAVT